MNFKNWLIQEAMYAIIPDETKIEIDGKQIKSIDMRFEDYLDQDTQVDYIRQGFSAILPDGRFLNRGPLWGDNEVFIGDEPEYKEAPDDWMDHAQINFKKSKTKSP